MIKSTYIASRFISHCLVAAAILCTVPGSRVLAQLEQEQQLLETETLVVITATGRHEFEVEIADDASEQSRGLMFREAMPASHGMLFDFGQSREVRMWMKNTPMSLDMVFVRADGTVSRVAERTEPFSLEIISSRQPVAFVLEIRAGVAKLIGLKPGDRLEHRLFR